MRLAIGRVSTVVEQAQSRESGKPLNITCIADVFGFAVEDISLEGYQADLSIVAPIAD